MVIVMSKLYLITGPAGVGKSTVSKLLAEGKEKSALIEGDDIYHFVKGGYVSPWKDGNHLEVFWKNCFDIINNFLECGYDVVFNYIINKEDLEMIKKRFPNIDIKFVLLIADDETLIDRDNQRNEDCRMGERVLILKNSFIKQNFPKQYILDTSRLSLEDIVREVDNNNYEL